MSTRPDVKQALRRERSAPAALASSDLLIIDSNFNVVVPALRDAEPKRPVGRRGERTERNPALAAHLERTMEIVIATYREATKSEPAINEQALLQAMSTGLAAAAQESSPATSVEERWQALLLKNLADKTHLLASTKFRSTSAAAAVLGIQEPAIRKRIRDNRLFALATPGSDEYRIPVWALGLSADDTKALVAAEDDAWALYLYLETPSGALNGMRPFELLLPTDSLTSEQKGKRQALLAFRGLSDRGSLLSLVVQDLESDKAPTA